MFNKNLTLERIQEVKKVFMQIDLVRPYDKGTVASAKPLYLVKKNDQILGGAGSSLKGLAEANGFGGEAGSVLANADGVLVGIGDGKDPFAIASAAERLPEGTFFIHEASLSDNAATQAVHGWLLGGYQFADYTDRAPKRAVLIAPENADLGLAQGEAVAVARVRDLVNTPANDMTPATIEAAACELAETHGASVSVIEGDDLLDENFPMVHAVGRASVVAPRLIDLVWGDERAPTVTLVGKGVSFDSGGLNIKGASGMAIMKKDMGGAAHVLALSEMIMSEKLNVRLRMIVPAVENAIAGNAFRPGDVLSSRKGLSVEIGNTDAEGRLILADALALGGEANPDLMISMATLTGAARVALGPDLAPFYCDDDGLANALEGHGRQSADPVWRMPLWDGYDGMLSPSIADINHISAGGFAGSITAALFLRRFIPNETPWMHFDIYAWQPKAKPGRPVGGAAQAVRALGAMLRERYVP